MSAAPLQRISFGTSQERNIFPLHYANDRLGSQMPRHQPQDVGPGCYDNHKFGSILHNLQKTPESKRGYVLAARTAARFPPCNKTLTPSPGKYQPDQTQSRVPPPGKTPFNSTMQRFDSTSSMTKDGPGPGTYVLDTPRNRKVTWPMCFGSPDWSKLPQLERKSLRVKLNSDKEFQKHRSRVAYLSLYY